MLFVKTTPVYAAILTVFYILLTINTIRGRRLHSIALGDGNIDEMRARIRAHANFAEYAPLFIILLSMAEHQGLPNYIIHVFGMLFFLGRLSHAYGLLIAEPLYNWLTPRVTGMLLTLSCLAMLAIILLYKFGVY